jgi:hypothetical protein
MGRKGVSKRKPPKSVNQKTLGKGEIDVVLGVTRISESSVAQSIGKGKAISVGKGRKKK